MTTITERKRHSVTPTEAEQLDAHVRAAVGVRSRGQALRQALVDQGVLRP